MPLFLVLRQEPNVPYSTIVIASNHGWSSRERSDGRADVRDEHLALRVFPPPLLRTVLRNVSVVPDRAMEPYTVYFLAMRVQHNSHHVRAVKIV